jgi:hypothetical protein
MKRVLYAELSMLIVARNNNPVWSEWWERHTNRINMLVKEHMPSGSGFDSGMVLEISDSHGEKLVFTTYFHHMKDGGYTDWTTHVVTVTPSFQGVNIRISGRNKDDIKDLIHEAFTQALKTEVEI